jgi:imidazoleglycerol-phosphate dehydratase
MTIKKSLTQPQIAQISRHTKETQIECQLQLHRDGTVPNSSSIQTGIGFLDHMLECFARHAQLSLKLTAKGDLHIDQHHTVEDVGITLGQAFADLLFDSQAPQGIERFGCMECPLDEALSKVVIDISGRPFLHWGVKFHRPFIGSLDSSLLKEFFGGFCLHAKWTVHIDSIRGENDHHVAESIFKAFARAAKQAISISDPLGLPSTKGMLV